MVESIKNINSRPELHIKKDKMVANKTNEVTKSSLKSSMQADTVEVGSTNATAAIKELAKAPDIDIDAVSRIKEAISKGDYPVDLEKVTDALMDAYIELKS
tara:strand:- start:57 stop:359 length:303 start_codon:yes stop_codon:yes gene_type:complete